MTISLFDYQQEDVDKLAQVSGALIASEMGTGKTYEAVALDLLRRQDESLLDKTLVVAPLSVLSSWEEHFNEMAPHLKTRVVNNKNKKMREMFLDGINEGENTCVLHSATQLGNIMPKISAKPATLFTDWQATMSIRLGSIDRSALGEKRIQKLREQQLGETISKKHLELLPKSLTSYLLDKVGVALCAAPTKQTAAAGKQNSTSIIAMLPEKSGEYFVCDATSVLNMQSLTLNGSPEYVCTCPPSIFIVHYDVLRLMPELAGILWLHVIADECHRMQNRKAQQTKALKKIKAVYKTGLSGTPVTNKTDKIWSVLNWLYPKQYRAYWKFYNEFVEFEIMYPEGYHKIIGPKNEAVLHEQIRPFYVRHLKLGKCCVRHPNGVQPFLPAKYYSTIRVPLLPPQRKAYDQMKKEMVAWVEEYGSQSDELSPLVAPIAISKLVRLQQFSVAHAQVENIKIAEGMTTKVHLSEPSSKLDALLQLLEDNPDSQVVVFSQFKQLINLLATRLRTAGISHVLLTGDVEQNQRKLNIAKFQAGEARVFCGTIAAGGVGVTLTAASTVVFLDRSYSPALNLQAEDRCIVEGQKVVTGRGVIAIENVVVGDSVLTHEGSWKSVTKTYTRFHRDAITEISYMRYSEPLTVTHDHRVLVQRGAMGKLEWAEASTVLPRDFLVFPKQQHTAAIDTVSLPEELKLYPERNQITQVNGRYSPLPDAIELSSELLYMFGWYIAEGCTSTIEGKGSFVSFSGHEKEESILKGFQLLFEEEFGINSTIYSKQNSKAIELRAYSKELALWFADWFGKGAHSKKIPQQLLQLPLEQAERLFFGYVDGDGYARGNQIEWVTVSETLALQIALLSRTLGYSPGLRRIKEGKNAGQWIGCVTQDLTANMPLNADSKYSYMPVRSVTTRLAHKQTRVYDLTVDGDHSFVVGLAAVHNCHRIGQKSAVQVIDIVSTNTVDRDKLTQVELKWSAIKRLLGDS